VGTRSAVDEWAAEEECARALTRGPNLLEMQVDPEKDEWPQQHGEDCRDDRLHRVEMLEVVVSRRHDHADDDVDAAGTASGTEIQAAAWYS
jgi:hypothetical protein